MNFQKAFWLAAILGGGLFVVHAQTNSQTQRVIIWKSIGYPFPKPGEWNVGPVFLLRSGEEWGQTSRGLGLDIEQIAQGAKFIKTNGIAARLYRASGDVVEPTTDGKRFLKLPFAVGSSAPGEELLPEVMTWFPWGTNELEESWIEVTIWPERYWLEISYGFDQNPEDPLPSSMPGGVPKFIPAMNALTEHDHVVRWDAVNYDLGKTSDGREVSLSQSNPFYAKSEVELYRFEKSQDLYSPHTEVHLRDSDGTVCAGRCVSLHLDDSGMRRTDTFNVGADSSDIRCWGQIEVSIGGEVYRVSVPSSLYKRIHGHAYKPAATDFLSNLRVGMTFGEVDRISRNFVNNIRDYAVSSASLREYRLVVPRDSSEATIKFDESNRLVSWK
ncbi:MAG TPA: hypothetical protein VN873_19760 [Candidatus Angelobacter sp.]|nr:hypothetical protein [Candidatus Angelobacter sp.]